MTQPDKLEFHQVNAFTKNGMNVLGNPATICLINDFLDDITMGKCAKELASPMTSFVRPTNDPYIFEIRHFSPDGLENHVCGHATVAAAELLAMKYPDFRKGREITFKLNPKYAINSENSFIATIKGNDISLKMPAVTEMKEVKSPKFYSLLAEALQIKPSDIVKPAYYAPRIINYVVELKNQDVLINMRPDFNKLANLAQSKKFSHEGIMATVKSEAAQYDTMTRVFLPIIGVDEDIACGSANCSVIPYWKLKNKTAFPSLKDEFNNLFPYPPEQHNGFVGGVQHLKFDAANEQIILTGQASYKHPIEVDLTKWSQLADKKKGPQNPSARP